MQKCKTYGEVEKVLPHRRFSTFPGKVENKKKKRSDAVDEKEEKVAHTRGLGNVEEGRIAEKKPKKRRINRKRPVLGASFRKIN